MHTYEYTHKHCTQPPSVGKDVSAILIMDVQGAVFQRNPFDSSVYHKLLANATAPFVSFPVHNAHAQRLARACLIHSGQIDDILGGFWGCVCVFLVGLFVYGVFGLCMYVRGAYVYVCVYVNVCTIFSYVYCVPLSHTYMHAYIHT